MSSDELTNREREILLLAAEGHTDKEIAERLGITHGTVATHWTRMRERTGTVNRAQVMAQAIARIVRQTEAELSKTAGLYQALIESLEDFAVFLFDRDRVVTTWNPGCEKILGYAKDEWIGRSGDVLFTPEDRAAGAPEKEQGTADREGRALDDRWHVRKDGSRFWASGVVVPIRDAEREIVSYCKILRDLTHLKRMEDRLIALGEDPREP